MILLVRPGYPCGCLGALSGTTATAGTGRLTRPIQSPIMALMSDQQELTTRPAAAMAPRDRRLGFVSSLEASSLSDNTKRSYETALQQLGAWLAGRPLGDAALANYLEHMSDAGKAPASARMIVASVRAFAKAHGQPNPVGPRTEATARGYARRHADRGRGQAPAATVESIAAILATACTPRRFRQSGRVESEADAQARGREDSAIASPAVSGRTTSLGGCRPPLGRYQRGQPSGGAVGARPFQQDQSGRRDDGRSTAQEWVRSRGTTTARCTARR